MTAGVIRKDGRFLVAKRKKGTHLEGTWEFPGGKREEGESLSACLKRELLEELGIEVSVGPRIDSVAHEYSEKHVLLHGFLCTWLRGEPKPLECQAVRWVESAELPTLTLPPPDEKILGTLLKSHVFKEWMKGTDMFYKKNSQGYNRPAEGIKFKSLTHGEKTHMCEFILDGEAQFPSTVIPTNRPGIWFRESWSFGWKGRHSMWRPETAGAFRKMCPIERR